MTSAVSVLVSESTLLGLYGTRLLDAAPAAVVATMVGTVPSYLMSRHWIWPEADRAHAGRQALWYWVIALVSLALSAIGTAVAASHAPSGHAAHLLVVGAAYLGVYGVLWITKFLLLQRTLFKTAGAAPSGC